MLYNQDYLRSLNIDSSFPTPPYTIFEDFSEVACVSLLLEEAEGNSIKVYFIMFNKPLLSQLSVKILDNSNNPIDAHLIGDDSRKGRR